jgi:hypothetical protein
LEANLCERGVMRKSHRFWRSSDVILDYLGAYENCILSSIESPHFLDDIFEMLTELLCAEIKE